MASALDRSALCMAVAVVVGAAALLAACNAYDEGRIGEPPSSGSGQGGSGSGGQGGQSGGGAGAGGGAATDGGMCVEQDEACNLADDDCDGDVDEDTVAACLQIVVNAETECVEFSGTARCLKIRCLDGYADGDGKPENGCETELDDGGTDQDAGS